MDEKQLSIKDLSEIIEIGAKYEVQSLKCGSLEITFGKKTEIPPNNSAVAAMTDDEHAASNKAAIEDQEIEIKEARIAQMLIEDPAQAERLIADGDLEDDDSDND